MKNFESLLDYRKICNEPIHSAVSLMIVVLALVLVLGVQNLKFQLSVFTACMLYFFYLSISFKIFFKTVFYTFSFSVFYALMALVFPAQESFFYNKSVLEIFLNRELLQTKEFFNFSRVFLVSTLSVLSLVVIKAEIVLLYFVQKFRVSVLFVYPLLFAINAMALFKIKYDLYLFNNKLRNVKSFVGPRLLFQFLVFIIRFSESGALSLVARGLSDEKKYYYNFSLNQKDKVVVGIVITLFGVCALIK